MPVIAGLLAFASFASLGIPGLSGFVGEFLSLLGAWQSALPAWIVFVSSLGVLLGAAYMLWMIQRVIMGQPSHVIADCPDATPREIFVVAPLVDSDRRSGVELEPAARSTSILPRAPS